MARYEHLPDDIEYTPVWDVTPAKWTQVAIDKGMRKQLTSADAVAGEFLRGRVISFGTGPANSSLNGLRALGVISNCPIVAIVK